MNKPSFSKIKQKLGLNKSIFKKQDEEGRDKRNEFFQEFLQKSADSEYCQLYQSLTDYPIDNKIQGLHILLETLPLKEEEKKDIEGLLKKMEGPNQVINVYNVLNVFVINAHNTFYPPSQGSFKTNTVNMKKKSKINNDEIKFT